MARGELGKGAARNHRSTLTSFTQMVGKGRDPATLTRRHVERWMGVGHYAASTRRTRFTQLRLWFDWLMREGYCRRNPCDDIPTPKAPKFLPRSLRDDECRLVVAACPDDRWRTIVLLMLHLGLRAIEIERAQVGDIDLRRGVMLVRGKGYEGAGSRALPLPDEARSAVDRWIIGENLRAGPLFPRWGDPTTPISAGYVSKWVSKIMDEAGVKSGAYDGRSAHALRHTMAQSGLESCGNVETVRQALGHANLSTTQVYLRGWTAGLTEAMSGRHYTDLQSPP
jgi:integrase